jgi:death-on-curing protein
MRHLTLGEVVELHFRIIRLTGGSQGLRDLSGLESALAQPKATFEGRDLYVTLHEKVAALGFSLVRNHPFVDGNKRVAHAAMETLLLLNGRELEAPVDEQERFMTDFAAGQVEREQLVAWLDAHTRPRG